MRRIRTLHDIELYLEKLIESDTRLAPIKRIAGPLPLRLSSPDFSGLAGIVVSQHISKPSAVAIMQRLENTVKPLTAERLVRTDGELLSGAGLTRAKRQTLQDVAQAVVAGELDLSTICELGADEAQTRLTKFKGIGPWTAEVFLLFCGGHIDVFPAGDIALRTAIGEAFDSRPRPSAAQVRKISNQWAPLRGVAARLFWAYFSARKTAVTR